MKKSVLGIVAALIFGTTAIANENIEMTSNNVVDEEIECIDSWMTNFSSWASLESSAFDVDREEELVVEGWMINLESKAWIPDKEEELEVEDWMTKIADLYLGSEETEEDLTLEAWMLNPTSWIK